MEPMDNVKMIYRKEISAFFNSPVAYIVLIVFALIAAWFFSNTFFLTNQSDLRNLFDIIPIVYVFFVPAVTMGLIARERNAGTMEFLTTLPITDGQIVWGKFLAALSLIGVALLFTFVHFFTLLIVGKHVDVGALISGYFGLWLVGAVYVAIGVFGSAITNNQITAFIISFMIIFILFILEKVLIFAPTFLAAVFQYISMDYHLENISRGVIDSRNLIYFGSVIALFLLLSTRVLEMRKWK
jgi:ABC-2 type transport system permease protein